MAKDEDPFKDPRVPKKIDIKPEKIDQIVEAQLKRVPNKPQMPLRGKNDPRS